MRRLLGLVLVAAACRGHDGNHPSTSTLPLDELRDSFHAAWCTYLVRCGDFPDMATCMGANILAQLPIDPNASSAVEAHKAVYDEAAAQSCFDQIAANTCDLTDSIGRPTTAPALGPNPAICAAIVRGTIAGGGTCSSDAECGSGRCDVVTDCGMACCTGTCEATRQQPIPSGGGCNNDTDVCSDGTYCSNPHSLGAEVCTPLITRGGVCDAGTSENECEDNLACTGPMQAGAIWTCEPLPAVGEPCPNGMCRDEGVGCNAAGVCAPVGLPGAPCTVAGDCSRFYRCDATGHCARGPIAGEACTLGCFDTDSYCIGQTCRLRLPDGAFCGSQLGRMNDVCQSGFCKSSSPDPRLGICAPRAGCF